MGPTAANCDMLLTFMEGRILKQGSQLLPRGEVENVEET